MSVRETVSQIYQAYEARDLQGVLDALPEGFCFEWPFGPEASRYAGMCRGKKELVERLGSIAEDFTFNSYRTSNIIVEGDRAAAEVAVNLTSVRTGVTFDMTIAHFWRFENGKPVYLAEYMDNALVAEHVG